MNTNFLYDSRILCIPVRICTAKHDGSKSSKLFQFGSGARSAGSGAGRSRRNSKQKNVLSKVRVKIQKTRSDCAIRNYIIYLIVFVRCLNVLVAISSA